MKDIIIKNFQHMLHGADYNPDQWINYPDALAEDLRLMKLANCNEMTVGIFAWSMLEPVEGKFNFDFLDRIMDEIYNAGGRVILATPSGAMPVWMAEKYPEVTRVDEFGNRYRFGGRHNHCNNSPIYREKVRIINTELAARYAKHPALIAWHVSNEYGNSTNIMECYCDYCREGFRKWLKNKYGTIEKLNHEWWTAFWSHTYSDWNQIEPPGRCTDTTTHGRNLDWKRFISDSTIGFLRNEVEPLRKYSPDIPVTTNLMGFFDGIDYRELSKHIDFVSYDSYPKWRGQRDADIRTASDTAFVYDLMRSLKRRPFFLMESTPSVVNWHKYNKLKRPGMHELSSLQAVAHGADSVQYFQWRKSRGGSEKFHGAVVDHVGTESTRVFREVSRIGKRLKKLDEIVGTVPKVETAILYDWDNHWALDDCQGYANGDKKVLDTFNNYYRPFWKRGINTDVIGKNENFDNYRLIIAPMLYMVDNELCDKLCNFVKNGGTLLCTYMTGTVNENDLCHLGGLPFGKLKELFGIWNEEIDTLYPGEVNMVRLNDGSMVEAVDYCELIHDTGAQVLARYDSDFYKSRPALTMNQYGKGKAYYVTFRDKGDFTDRFVGQLIRDTEISSDFDGELPEGVTAHSRTDGENIYVFIENYNQNEIQLATQNEWINVEDGTVFKHHLVLLPQSALILKKVSESAKE